MSNNNNSNEKETDITVYGATSFAANHVLRYLLTASKQFQVDGKELRVTVAGRSQSKLEALRELDVFQNDRTATDKNFFHDIFVAEASDGPALEVMARRSKVILNCAGPFERYSSLVVAACAKVGTDYVDITGEGPWSATMRLRYGPQAKVSGARIISFCGYDSIPSEMVLLAAVDALRQRKKVDSSTVVEMESATLWHCMAGVPNGGTIQTVLEIPIDLWKDFFQTSGTLRPVPFFASDPLLLTHPEQIRHNPDYESTRNRFAWGEWMNQSFHIDIPFGLGISLPMVMAAIIMKVMQASAVALKYGPNFTIRERYLPLGYRWTRLVGLMAFGPLVAFQCGFFAIVTILFLPFGIGKALVNRFWPPGSGPSDYLVNLGSNSVYAMVTAVPSESDRGSRRGGLVDRAYCYMSYQGDAGNSVTAQCVAEAALTLVCNRDKLPPRSEDGFGTPAELLGLALLNRLKCNQVRPVTFTCSVRTRTPKNEMRLYLEQ